MIYQLRTYNTLAESKEYFRTIKEMSIHLKAVINETEKLRSKLSPDILEELHWPKTVQSYEMFQGIEQIRIDEDTSPNWETLVGGKKEISIQLLKEEAEKAEAKIKKDCSGV